MSMSRWWGGLYTAGLFGSAGWLLIYTLLPIPGVDALGGWNYVIALALLTTVPAVSWIWRGMIMR
jgi:hypothetical protein